MPRVTSFEELCLGGLKELYDAEHQIADALRGMAEVATSPRLRDAFSNHRLQTERHIQRLDQIFALLGKTPEREPCTEATDLIARCHNRMQEFMRGPLLDATLVQSAQKIEHYEMAAYGTLRTFYSALRSEGNLANKSEVALLLATTLQEEADADRLLTGLAETVINPEAARKLRPSWTVAQAAEAAQVIS